MFKTETCSSKKNVGLATARIVVEVALESPFYRCGVFVCFILFSLFFVAFFCVFV